MGETSAGSQVHYIISIVECVTDLLKSNLQYEKTQANKPVRVIVWFRSNLFNR